MRADILLISNGLIDGVSPDIGPFFRLWTIRGHDMRTPFKHQAETLRWASGRRRIALFHEMRLGKTLVAIRWAMRHVCFPVLVVCPLDVLETWRDELALEGITAEVCRGYSSEPERNAQWVLTSYESLRKNAALQACPWYCVILDEATAIRNPKAQITKVCCGAFKGVPFKAILAGLPAPESHLDYFCQLKFLNGKMCGFDNYWNFRVKMFDADQMGWDWKPKPGALAKILHEVDQYAHVLTRNQAGLGNVEIKESRRVQMPTMIRSVYRYAEDQFIMRETSTSFVPVVQTWLARLAGGCHPMAQDDFKVKAVLGLLADGLRDQQVIIWCTFNSEIERLHKKIRGSAVIHGDVSTADRAKINHDFQRGNIQTLICQTRCAKFGRNFSAASTAIYFSLPWDLLSYVQSRDRIVHPEKRDSTLTLQMLTRNSIDEDISLALLEKRNTSVSFKSLIGRNMLARREPQLIGRPS